MSVTFFVSNLSPKVTTSGIAFWLDIVSLSNKEDNDVTVSFNLKLSKLTWLSHIIFLGIKLSMDSGETITELEKTFNIFSSWL